MLESYPFSNLCTNFKHDSLNSYYESEHEHLIMNCFMAFLRLYVVSFDFIWAPVVL